MTKLLIGLLCVGAVATVGWAAAASIDDSEPARTVSIPNATTDDARATTAGATTGGNETEDVSGPCDEAEHANDPRCTGATGGATTGRDDDNGAEDVSGPCDEAEHANDPCCTGASTTAEDDDDRGDDHGGRGRDDDGGDEDRSGSNSGKG